MSGPSTHTDHLPEVEAEPFDALAETYDATFTDTRLGRLLRDRVWRTLDQVLPAEAAVLELGCGTGEDAARLSRRGHRVLGTDTSEEMLDRARRRVAERGDPERVEFVELDLDTVADGAADVLRVRENGPPDGPNPPDAGSERFDAVIANFGVLNCTDRWSELGTELARAIRPGGVAVFTVMGPYCPWEWIWHLSRFRPARAFRRISGRTRTRLETGPELEVHYPQPEHVVEAFAPAFRPIHREGIGTVLPPTYAGAALERANGVLDLLARWDRQVGPTSIGTRFSDHYLLILRRAEEPAPEPSLAATYRRAASGRVPPFSDGRVAKRDGIWRALGDERAEELAAFVEQYGIVRRSEGRGSDDPAFYRALPVVEDEHPCADDWTVRAQSFRTLVKRVAEPLEHERDRPLEILDLGAGNGWLSHRLAERGHRPVAVDVRTDERDGLGATAHYETEFPAVQADFRRLPFAHGSFDLIVFNASFHYAPVFETVLQEALRVLRRDGRVAIVDSPVYRDPASGRRMVCEREEAFEEEFGFRSDSLESEGFLTWDRIDELVGSSGCAYSVYRPRRSIRRTLAPITALLTGDREPAQMPVIEIREETIPPGRTLDRLRRGMQDGIRRLARLGWRLRRRFVPDRERTRSTEIVAGRIFVVLPDVFNPVLFRSGRLLGETVATHPPSPGAQVLDLGCGSGVGAVIAAETAEAVTAVDVNPAAVIATEINARLNDVDGRLSVREGDLFEPVSDRRFDLVLFNPPYFSGSPADAYDRAWRSRDVSKRFAEGLGAHLRRGGRAWLLLSTDADVPGFLRPAWERGFRSKVVARRAHWNETLSIYELSADRPIRSPRP